MRWRPTLAEALPVIFSLAMVAGCADTEKLKAFLEEQRYPVSGTEYRVLPPDVLTISSIHVPEINGNSQQVRPDGKINLPLVGEVYVADMTPKQIEDAIKKAAEKYYEEADSTVQVVGYNSQKIYVFGQVGTPGPQPWTGTDTLLDLLAKVQPTLLAWPERIRVLRGRQPTRGGYLPDTMPAKGVEKGRNKAGAKEITVNLMAMMKTGDLSRNILLMPDDIVYVPPNPFAAFGLELQKILFPVRPILEAVRVPATVEGATATGD